MAAAIEDDVLVHFVAQHVERRPPCERGERVDVGGGHDRAGGVVRRVDHQEPRPRCDRRFHGIPVDPVIRRVQRDDHGNAAIQLDRWQVGVVAGLQHDDLVARMHDRRDRGEDRLGAARGDRHLGVGIVGGAVIVRVLRGNRLAERRDPLHRRVLVQAAAHVRGDCVDERGIAVEVREPLRQVHRPDVGRELRHHREDGRADRRQSRDENRSSHRLPVVDSNTPVALFLRTASQVKCCPFMAT